MQESFMWAKPIRMLKTTGPTPDPAGPLFPKSFLDPGLGDVPREVQPLLDEYGKGLISEETF